MAMDNRFGRIAIDYTTVTRLKLFYGEVAW